MSVKLTVLVCLVPNCFSVFCSVYFLLYHVYILEPFFSGTDFEELKLLLCFL